MLEDITRGKKMFKVIKLENCTTFGFPSGNWAVDIGIEMLELESDLIVSYSSTSTLYDEKNYDEEKRVFTPLNNSIWHISKWTHQKILERKR